MKSWFVKLLYILAITKGAWAAIGEKEFSIVFIHIGKELPPYLEIALNQAHLFNPNAEIILLANKSALGEHPPWVTCISCESLKQSHEHTLFMQRSIVNRKFRNGFWLYTTERLFYLDDLMKTYGLKNVFHLENDNLLYVNLEEMLPTFIRCYPGIGVPFENEQKGIASFVFVASQTSIHQLAQFLLAKASTKKTEMELLGMFKNRVGRDTIDHLPNVIEGYPLNNLRPGVCIQNPSRYSNYLDQFGSLFDAATYGQFLGGSDPLHKKGPGYINEECVFNCTLLQFEWREDTLRRKIPYVLYSNKAYRLNNLHIHCKDLKSFASIP